MLQIYPYKSGLYALIVHDIILGIAEIMLKYFIQVCHAEQDLDCCIFLNSCPTDNKHPYFLAALSESVVFINIYLPFFYYYKYWLSPDVAPPP